MNEAVNESHIVNKTGAVDKYFKKLLSIILFINCVIEFFI